MCIFNKSTLFLTIYIYTTYLLSDFGLANMEEDHLFGLKFLVYKNWKIENKSIRYFSIAFLFVWSYGSTTQHPPAMNRNI